MTRTKICGISTRDAIDAAVAAGADYIGLVFFAKSPRNVTIAEAARLADHARAPGRSDAPKIVALTVNAERDRLGAIVEAVAPDVIQLHGSEDADAIRAARTVAPLGTQIWKAVAVATSTDVENAFTLQRPGDLADLILFDAKPPADAALPGGNGLSFDWRILDGVAAHNDFALAGGLTPDNVADAIALTNPAIVDVSSGVEMAPGTKSPDLISRFIAQVNAASIAA